MLGVKYVSVPSSGHTMVMTSHQPDLLASSRRKSWLESECELILSWVKKRDWQLENARTSQSGLIVSQSIRRCQPPGPGGDKWHVVTPEAGPGPSSDPGAPWPRGADTRRLKDEMDWYERIVVYCVLTSILLTRHYLSLTQTPETPLMPSRRFHWFTF